MPIYPFSVDNKLYSFPKCLRPIFEELCLRSVVGLSTIAFNDVSIIRNRIADQPFENYHYTVKVPYASKRFKWDIIFDPEDYTYPPDIDFNDDSFLNDPDIEMLESNVPSWGGWNIKDSTILTKVLNELLDLYKNLQIEKLQKENIYSRYWEEYITLISEDNGIKPEDVEISIDGTTITFLIAISLDFSLLPEYIQENSHQIVRKNPGANYVHLRINVSKLDGSCTSYFLHYSPQVGQVLGDQLAWPNLNKSAPLTEYVAAVTEVLNCRMSFLEEHFKSKKLFISSLSCSKWTLELDNDHFNTISFLWGSDDFDCMVTVSIGKNFPQEKPCVQLSSVFCQKGYTCHRTLDGFPYNPTSSAEENALSLLQYLDDVAPNFAHHKCS